MFNVVISMLLRKFCLHISAVGCSHCKGPCTYGSPRIIIGQVNFGLLWENTFSDCCYESNRWSDFHFNTAKLFEICIWEFWENVYGPSWFLLIVGKRVSLFVVVMKVTGGPILISILCNNYLRYNNHYDCIRCRKICSFSSCNKTKIGQVNLARYGMWWPICERPLIMGEEFGSNKD